MLQGLVLTGSVPLKRVTWELSLHKVELSTPRDAAVLNRGVSGWLADEHESHVQPEVSTPLLGKLC